MIESAMKTMLSSNGNRMLSCHSGMLAKGATAPNATSATAVTATADQVCAALGAGPSAPYLFLLPHRDPYLTPTTPLKLR